MNLLNSTFIAASLAQAAILNASSENYEKGSTLIQQYYDCIDRYAELFERAGETISDTVDAVFAACQNERASIVLHLYETQRESEAERSIVDIQDFVTEAFESGKRDEVLVALFERRSR